MAEPRRLRGHKATATCCVASLRRPGIIVTSGDDGRICWFDMRCKDVQVVMDAGTEAVSSLCFKSGDEDIIYASTGKEIKSFDVHMLGDKIWKPLESYEYNKDEINQVACNSRSSFVAAADDGGEVKIIDISQKRIYKTLRNGHSSICSSVQFIPWRPWEVITGGLDSKLIMWDFSKGRPFKIVEFGLPDMKDSSAVAQCLNPAFIHSIAVPDLEMLERSDRICVVGRGDGVVDVINMESELAVTSFKNSTKSKKASNSATERSVPADSKDCQNGKKWVHLDYSIGGHTAAVSCVTFSLFGEKGKFVCSGGNDKSVKIWDSRKCFDSEQTDSNSTTLHMSLNLNKKVNWLCTAPTDSDNLVICDTTKVVKVFSIS